MTGSKDKATIWAMSTRLDVLQIALEALLGSLDCTRAALARRVIAVGAAGLEPSPDDDPAAASTLASLFSVLDLAERRKGCSQASWLSQGCEGG